VIEQIGTREVHANPWLRLREDRIRYPDGSESVYTVLERPDFATVIARENGGCWLVEQYRYPLGLRSWELPQGAWGRGRSGTPLELAQTELREETGLRAARWTHLGRLAAQPGLSSQYFDVYLAEDLTAGPPEREQSEADMQHRWFSDAEVTDLIRTQRIVDCHTLAAFGLADRR
jgi:8-oxo-dGTP pyrophosphatase MutT (NUDIX family)